MGGSTGTGYLRVSSSMTAWAAPRVKITLGYFRKGSKEAQQKTNVCAA